LENREYPQEDILLLSPAVFFGIVTKLLGTASTHPTFHPFFAVVVSFLNASRIFPFSQRVEERAKATTHLGTEIASLYFLSWTLAAAFSFFFLKAKKCLDHANVVPL
jgi:hypothetical protein